MILMAYRHGLRSIELCSLRWDQVDLDKGHLSVWRAKGGTASTHPFTGSELRGLRQMRREAPSCAHVFLSERGTSDLTSGLQEGATQARRGASPPAPPCLRLQTRQRRAGYAEHPTLPRTPKHQLGGDLHSARRGEI
jgi:integrase